MAKIMIVDDSAYARRVHRSILEKAGHSVVEASTGMSAIEMYTVEKPTLVLLDLSMEDIGGLEVLRTIRQVDGEANVIVISADIQRSTADDVSTGGAKRFLHKPANAESILGAVNEIVGTPIS